MSLDDLVALSIPVFFVLFLILERLLPARPLPKVSGWFVKGILFFLLIGGMNAAIPAAILSVANGYTVFNLSGIGAVPGAILGLILIDLASYWIHRGMHHSPTVWRFTHQLHHSAERMDMLGASYFHPVDFLLQNVIPGTLVLVLLGMSPEAGALYGLLGFLIGVFPHLNVKTPAWLGYVLQRPEMHAVHHLRDVHAYNYGTLAFSDLLFGTWRNPAEFPTGNYGFWDGASKRVGAMLIGKDVSTPAEPRSASETAAA
ncbi:MAG: sterol desaturase family protein [Myxococcota bacterium]